MRNILNGMGIDTALVLLFLAAEVGRYGNFASLETLLMGVSMLILLVLPFFLPSATEFEPSLTKWLILRGLAAIVGLTFGLILPEPMRFLPMSFLILAGICSCFVQFYGLMKLRLAD